MNTNEDSPNAQQEEEEGVVIVFTRENRGGSTQVEVVEEGLSLLVNQSQKRGQTVLSCA